MKFTGGVRTAMYSDLPDRIRSTFGFQGCLASIDLNGEAADPINNALVPSPLVKEGCDGEIMMTLKKGLIPHWDVR